MPSSPQEPSSNSLGAPGSSVSAPSTPSPALAAWPAGPGSAGLLPGYVPPLSAPVGFAGPGAAGAYGCGAAPGLASHMPVADVDATAAVDTSVLAALKVLLNSPPSASMQTSGGATLTSAAAPPSMRVIGTPASLPAIDVGHGVMKPPQQPPSSPATPRGTAGSGAVDNMRRSISGKDPP